MRRFRIAPGWGEDAVPYSHQTHTASRCTKKLGLILAATLLAALLCPPAHATVSTYGNFNTLGVVLRPPSPYTAATIGQIRLYELKPGGDRRLIDPVRVSTFDYFAGSVFDLLPGTTNTYRADYYNLANTVVLTNEVFTGATRSEPGANPPATAEIHVAITGNDTAPGTISQPKRTIASAFAAVSLPGTHVILHEGTYYEGGLTPPSAGTSNAPIVIRAATGETATIDGSSEAMLQTGWTALGGGYFRRTFSGATWLVAFRNKISGETFRCYPIATTNELFGKYSGSPGTTFTKYNITGAYSTSGTTMTMYCPVFSPGGDIEMRVSIRDTGIDHSNGSGGQHHVIYDGLTFRFFQGKGIYVYNTDDIIIRNCHFEHINTHIGIKNDTDRLLVENNTFLDDCARWGFLSKGSDGNGYSGYIESGAINVYWPYDGRGLVFRRNTIDGLFDGALIVPTGLSPLEDTSETDFHDNTVLKTCDDTMEIDGFSRNVRVFRNRLSNSLAGVSVAQSVHGPTYVLYNEFFRMGNSTSVSIDGFQGFPIKANGGTDYGLTGWVYLYHNTSWTDVPATPAFRVQYASWQRLFMANNIWHGTATNWWNWQPTNGPVTMNRDIIHADIGPFLRVNSVGSYATPASCSAANVTLRYLTNAIASNPQLTAPAAGILTLATNSPAIDFGILLPGVNDLRYSGAAPDIGAHEIGSDIAVAFSTAAAAVPESATSLVVSVTLNLSVLQTVSVNYNVTGGSASNGLDYTLSAGLLVFAPEQTNRTITIPLLPDALVESNETVVLTLANPTNTLVGTPAQFTLTILDDDAPPPQVAFLQPSSVASETLDTASIPVALSAAYGLPVSVPYSLTGGSASNGVDYTLANGLLVFTPGQTLTNIVIDLLDDAITEINESILLQLGPPTNASLGAITNHTFTIIDNDPVSVRFDHAADSAGESISPVTVGLSLSAPVSFTVSVSVLISGGTASASGIDYGFSNTACTFPPGQTHTSLVFSVTDDIQAEANETILLGLASPSNALLGNPSQFTYTIIDDDQPILYVDRDAAGANNGASWANAFTNLQTALATVAPFSQIWVAEGTYRPGPATNSTFAPPANIALHGGFAGTESQLGQRTPAAHPTILSGDLAANDTPNWGNRADNALHVLLCQSNNVTLSGFIVRGGNAGTGSAFNAENQGGALWANNANNLLIEACVFADNAANAGGAIYLRRCASTQIRDCTFSANRATEAGSDRGSGAVGGEALTAGQGVQFTRCRFTGNTAPNGRGGVLYETTTPWEVNFANCLFAGNTAGDVGGALFLRSYNALLMNCSFSGNSPSAVFVRDASPVAQNSILWGDTDEVVVFAGTGDFIASDSDIDEPNYAGNSQNIRVDPQWRGAPSGIWTSNAVYNPQTGQTTLFGGGWIASDHAGRTVNPDTHQNRQFLIAANDTQTLQVWGDASVLGITNAPFRIYDYHLTEGSPCLDTAGSIGAPADDLDGTVRPQRTGIDMGAYELSTFRADFSGTPREGFAPLPTVFTAVTYGANSQDLYYWWDFDGNGSNDAQGSTLATVTNTYNAPGAYTVILTASNAAGEVSTIIKPAYVLLSPPIIYVSLAGAHQWPYANWSSAATNIAAAVAIAVDDTLILVSNGTFQLESEVDLLRGITLQSAFGATQTVLRGRDVVRCLFLGHPDAVADGFTLTDGWADDGAGAYLSLGGTLRNCIIRGNNATDEGGGIYLYQGGLAENCVVFSNSCVDRGGGVFLDTQGTLANSTIASNSAGFSGGGVACENGGTVTNCLISTNDADNDGGGVLAALGGWIAGCTISGNHADDDGGGAYLTGSGVVERCTIVANTAGDDAGGAQCGDDLGVSGGLLRECLFSGNLATTDKGGGAFLWNSGQMINCVAASNTANEGGGAYCRNGGTFQNCTFSLNQAGLRGGGLWTRDGGLTRNTILFGNTSLTSPEAGGQGTAHTFANSCASTTLAGSGNITNNPTFTNAPGGDFHLAAGSPCIDAGTATGAPAIDRDGIPRPQAAAFDIGAYEFYLTSADSDGDGVSNLSEYEADTDPYDMNSVLTLTGITTLSNSVQLQWKGGSASWQYMEIASALGNGSNSWSAIYTGVPPTALSNTLTHPANTNPAAFYRLRALRP